MELIEFETEIFCYIILEVMDVLYVLSFQLWIKYYMAWHYSLHQNVCHYNHTVPVAVFSTCYELLVSRVVRTFIQYYLTTHINDSCCTAVQVFVQIIEHLPQLLHGLLVRLQQHGLKVDRQPIPGGTPHYTFTLIMQEKHTVMFMLKLLLMLQHPRQTSYLAEVKRREFSHCSKQTLNMSLIISQSWTPFYF